jgi:hypothetical protein
VSDGEIGKKEGEREALHQFLEAYALTTGQSLSVVYENESPDFICTRPSGEPVGIELTQVMRSPTDAHWDRILKRKEELEPFEAQALIHDLLNRKETARANRYSTRVEKCILVLQLVDGSLERAHDALDGLQEDFVNHGFAEVWIADYSGLEAFGYIELYGLFPKEYWGFHPRANPDRKPYG